MGTAGMKGVWGLDRLDRTGLATWKLGVLLIGASTGVALLLSPVLGNVNTESIAFETLPTDLFLISGFVSLVFVGVSLVLTIALSRTTEQDLKTLIPIDNSVTAEIKRLRPPRSVLLAVMGFSALFWPAVVFYTAMSAEEVSMLELASMINSAGVAATLVWFGILPLLGIASGPLTVTLFIQPLVLSRVAKQLNIDLLRLIDYQVIANPAVRLVITVLLVLSCFPLIGLWLDNPSTSTQLFLIGAFFIVLVGLVVLFYTYPVLVLRNRVRKEKENELRAVFQSLGGGSVSFASLDLSDRSQHTSDLLTHLMFVESRWEWPVSSHITKLVLWGLLVPSTWVLSATIENMLY